MSANAKESPREDQRQIASDSFVARFPVAWPRTRGEGSGFVSVATWWPLVGHCKMVCDNKFGGIVETGIKRDMTSIELHTDSPEFPMRYTYGKSRNSYSHTRLQISWWRIRDHKRFINWGFMKPWISVNLATTLKDVDQKESKHSDPKTAPFLFLCKLDKQTGVPKRPNFCERRPLKY
jgi:hypothetical protein